MNCRLLFTILSVSLLFGSVKEAFSQVPIEESISTRSLIRSGSHDVIYKGIVDRHRESYRDSLSRYIAVESSDVSSGEKNTFEYYNAVFGADTLAFKRRRPVFRYDSRGKVILEFKSSAYPHHRYTIDITGRSEETIDSTLKLYEKEGEGESLMNNEQTCIFYALNLLLDSEGVCPDPIISNDTNFTDGRQLNSFFDYILDTKTTIRSRWSDVRKATFPDSCVLAFLNSRDEIIHAVYCEKGGEFNPKGYAFFSKSGLFSPVVQSTLKDVIESFSIYSSKSLVSGNPEYADRIVVYTLKDKFRKGSDSLSK